MKKIIIIILVVGIVICTGLIAYLKLSEVDVPAVLPDNALIYVSASDIRENLDEIKSTEMWNKLSSIDWKRLIAKTKLKASQKSGYLSVLNALENQKTIDMFLKFAGKELSFAIYPVTVDFQLAGGTPAALMGAMIPKVLNNIAVVVRVPLEVQLGEFILETVGEIDENVSLEQGKYEGYTVYSLIIKNPRVKLGIVRIKDLVVIGLGSEMVETCIQVHKDIEVALADNSGFQETQNRRLEDAGIFSYINIDGLSGILKDISFRMFDMARETGINNSGKLSGDAVERVKQQIETNFNQVAGLKQLGLSAVFDDLMKFKTSLFFEPQRLNSVVADIYTCPAGDNASLDFIPEDVLVYQWSNCNKLDYFWNGFKKESEMVARRTGGATSPLDQVAAFEQAIGLSVEKDLFPIFGEETGGYLEDVDLSGPLPIPHLVFFVSINDQNSLESLLKDFTSNPNFPKKEKDYKGVTINYVELPFVENIRPAYCFLDKFFFIASDIDLLEKSIDVSEKTSSSLVSGNSFKSVDYGLTESGRGTIFIRISKLVDAVKTYVEWGDDKSEKSGENLNAFLSGSRQRLSDVRISISQYEKEIAELKSKIRTLDEEILYVESQGVVATAEREEKKGIEEEIEGKKKDIKAKRSAELKIVALIEQNSNSLESPKQRRYYIEQIIFPVLDSIGTISAFGAKVNLDGNILDATTYLKM